MANRNWDKELNNIGNTMRQAKTQQDDTKNTKIAWTLMAVSVGILVVTFGSDMAMLMFFTPMLVGALYKTAVFFAEESAPKLLHNGLAAEAIIQLVKGVLASLIFGGGFLTIAFVMVGGAFYFGLGYILGNVVVFVIALFLPKKEN